MSGENSDEPRNMGANMSTHSTDSAHAPSTTLGDGGSIMSTTSTPPIHHMDIDESSDDETHSTTGTPATTQQAPTSSHAAFFAGLRFMTAGKSNGIRLPDEKILPFDGKSRGAGEQRGKAVVDAAGTVSGGSSAPPNSITQSPPVDHQPGRESHRSEGNWGEHEDLAALEATKTALEAENTALAAETRMLKCMLENRVTHCLSAMATVVRESFLTAQRFATLDAIAINKPQIPAPHHRFYFLYGALADPATFQAAAEILDSSRSPPMQDARISGYHMVLVDKPFVHRSWLAAPDAPFLRTETSYHRLLPGPFANVVYGKVCEIDDELALKLQPYGFAVPTSCEVTLDERDCGGARKVSAGIFMLDRVMDAQIQRQFMMGGEDRDQYDRLLREKNAREKAAEEKAAEEKAAEEKAAEEQALKEATDGRDENDRGWPGWNGLDGDW